MSRSPINKVRPVIVDGALCLQLTFFWDKDRQGPPHVGLCIHDRALRWCLVSIDADTVTARAVLFRFWFPRKTI